MLANILVKYFEAGGPVMWPILVTGIVAVAVVGERAFWWFRESLKRKPQVLEKLFAAIEAGDFREASSLSKDSKDPIIRMIWHGMNHQLYGREARPGLTNDAWIQEYNTRWVEGRVLKQTAKR